MHSLRALSDLRVHGSQPWRYVRPPAVRITIVATDRLCQELLDRLRGQPAVDSSGAAGGSVATGAGAGGSVATGAAGGGSVAAGGGAGGSVAAVGAVATGSTGEADATGTLAPG